MNCRKISNKKNIIMLIIAIILFTISIVQLLYRVLHDKVNAWPKSSWDGVFLGLGIISFFGVVIYISQIHNIIKINEQLSSLPYNFDYEKELSTFVIIGRPSQKAKNDAIHFNKYSEWKNYINNSYKDLYKNEDFFRYLVRLYRIQVLYTDYLMKLYFPIIMSVISFYWTANNLPAAKRITSLFITMMFLMFFSFI